ncbi:MAG: type III-B CRISPR module RAMP protein Cmr1 [Paraglaciecola sp.]|nr:type III-B CRISPR module RAMP protein Cmr1 [Paraglaciecola sp.]
MHIINAQFELVSPMFIAGYTDQDHDDYLTVRPTAIKGALRFWWRALVYPALRQQSATKQLALKKLHQAECALFGSAASEKEKSGQSLVMLRVPENVQVKDTIKAQEDISEKGDSLSKFNGCQYLLGMGLYNFKAKLLRSYLKVGATFSLQLAFKPAATSEQITQVKQAILAFGLLGTLGARARKGFGSVQLLSWEENKQSLHVPLTKQDYKDEVAKLFNAGQMLQELPPFTAFSAYAMADISVSDKTAIAVLNSVGEKQQRYRGYGEGSKGPHLVSGKPALQLFTDDHDNMLRFIKEGNKPVQPRRLVFGIPHNIRFSDGKGSVGIDLAQKNKTRRASPLFVHVHKFEQEYVAVQSLLAAEFFPENTDVKYKNRSYPAAPVDWSVITDYMTLPVYQGVQHQADGFTGREAIFKGSLR